MLNLDKLEAMLDSALESETESSLNEWINQQLEADRANDIIRDADFGVLQMFDNYPQSSSKSIIETGMAEYILYNTVVVSDTFDSNTIDEYNLAA